MARVDESGQWIVLMGIMVSIALFFLAFVLNQSTLVGMTTAESVLEFPKNEIQDLRSEIFRWKEKGLQEHEMNEIAQSISKIARARKSAEIFVHVDSSMRYPVTIHYNNGVMKYDESATWN